jgi:hypothetical protein
MDKLRKQVRRAQWWLGVQRLIGALGWCWSLTLLAALVFVVIDKYRPLGIDLWVYGAVALAAGLLLAVIWAMATGRGALDAAIEIDRRFGLKERVSTSLSLSEQEHNSQLGQALVADAMRRVERIDVASGFPIAARRSLLYPLVPALAAVLVAVLVNPITPGPAVASGGQDRERVKKATKELQDKIAERRKKAEQQGLEDAKDLFGQLERDMEGLTSRSELDRKQTLAKMNDLSRQLAERRQELAAADTIRKQLNQLDDMGKGPADKLLDEIQRGNFRNAIEQLEKLKADLAAGKLTPDQQKQLAQQLNEMKQKLQKLVEAQKEAEKDLQKRAEEARRAGRNDEAERLEQQLDRLRQQAPQMKQLEQLAQKLGQCANCAQAGQLKEAADMLNQLQGDLEGMQAQLQELEMLDEAAAEMVQAKLGMNLDQPNFGDWGMGAGTGAGRRAEQKDDVKFFDAKSPVKLQPGKASVVGEVEGPNVAGDVQQQIQQQLESARSEAGDPLTGQRLPRKHREHALEYFERFREGQ